jgi:hypothetical protein
MTKRKQICVKLIDRFDTMLSGLAGVPTFGHVRFLDLRNTLSTGADYKTWWGKRVASYAEGVQCRHEKIRGHRMKVRPPEPDGRRSLT